MLGLCLILVMTGCAGREAPPPEPTGPAALAVWPLEDLSLPGSGRPESAELMTAGVMEAVEASGGYTLVERERLVAVLRELSLGSSDLAAESTGLRIGRIVGARLMLFGTYQAIASRMRVDLRMVEVETGKVIRTAQKTASTGTLSHMMRVAAETARELLQQR
jgi:hypothetical protein